MVKGVVVVDVDVVVVVEKPGRSLTLTLRDEKDRAGCSGRKGRAGAWQLG